MSKYKVGDKFKFEIEGVEKMYGHTVYRISGFQGAFSENVIDGLKKIKRKKKIKGGKRHGKRKSNKQK